MASQEHITATGIRIVGTGAVELAARAAAMPLEPPAAHDVLWASRLRARPRIGGGSAVPAILKCVGDLLHQEWDACPPLTRDTPFTRPPARFQGISWDVIGEAGAWRGELVWRHPHPVLSGVACTTHLIIDEQQATVTLVLRVAVEGGVPAVRGLVGAGQSRPALLDALRDAVTLTFDSSDGKPVYLADADIASFVQVFLLNEKRSGPLALLAPLEDDTFLVPPDELASELFGLAPLYVVQRHASTFRLTDLLGDKRLSVYWGALRVYRSEFSCADRPEDHWLLLRDRVEDPLERAALIGKLGQLAATRYAQVDGVRSRREALASPRPVAAAPALEAPEVVSPPPAQEVAVAPAGAGMPEEVGGALRELPGAMHALASLVERLSGTIGDLVTANQELSDEIGRLRATTAIRATSSNAVDRRLSSIEALLRPADDPAGAAPVDVDRSAREDEGETRPTLVDAVRHAGSEYSDALLMLDAAEASALDSPFEDVDRTAAVLQGMAFVARRRQQGALGSGLRAAFQELGLDYRSGIARSTSEKLHRQYLFSGPDGRGYECLEHIAIGDTYDPRYCLRIYFTSRAPSEPRFVIGHVGRHLTVKSST